MPQLLIRGMTAEQVCQISTPLIHELADICHCETDYFIVEVMHSSAIHDGVIGPSFPFIEVAWFERGKTIRDRFATTVTTHVKALGIDEVEIAFVVYREDSYYINGVPCNDSAD